MEKKRYSRDLTNVKVGDIRSVQFDLGPKHPLYKKYVPAVITIVNGGYDGKGISAKTLNPFIWPEDPEGSWWEDSCGKIHYETVPAHEATHEGWVSRECIKGHVRDTRFPVKLWVARTKAGELEAFIHKPEKIGQYWVDRKYGFPCFLLPKDYYPEVSFSSGPKEVTYIQSIK